VVSQKLRERGEMLQALHILKKDIRYLRLEISLVLMLAAIFASTEMFSRNRLWVRVLLAIAAAYLIARLIHAEAIPGDSQFWISRPYRWKSLLGAKFMFILAFVNLPIFAARLSILIVGGFPLSSALPGLLWSQFLILFAASFPIAALAAVTAGLVPFIFSALVLLAAGIGIEQMMVPPSLPAVRTLVDPVQWVWDAIAALTLTAAAVLILYIQYKNRNTRFSRTLAIGAASLTAAAYLYIPWPVALAVQTHLSKKVFDSSSIYLALDPSSKRTFSAEGRLSGIQLDFPIAVTGVPDAIDIEADALAVTLQSSDGQSWKSGFYDLPGVPKKRNRSGVPVFNGLVVIPRAFFNEERERSVTFRASIYLTLFGNDRMKTVPLQSKPVNVMDGLQCAIGALSDLHCASPFRWPARLVYAKFGETDIRSFTRLISYSPFPADLSLDNVEIDGVSRPASAREVTIVSKEPLENIRLNFEAPGIKLADFVETTAGSQSEHLNNRH
jgi:hypothetical protein